MGKQLRKKNGEFDGFLGDGKTPPPSTPLDSSLSPPVPETPLDGTASYATVYEAYKTSGEEPQNAYTGVTDEDVKERSWMREQAERMGMDPDMMVGSELFTAVEWEAMTSTREARIAFGYELACGCRPGSCSSEYGGDCWRNEALMDEMMAEDEHNRHMEVVNDPASVFYTDTKGRRWIIRDANDYIEYVPEDDENRAYETKGTVETVMVLIEGDNDYLESW